MIMPQQMHTSASEQEVIGNPFQLMAVRYYREASDQKKIRAIVELLFFSLFSNLQLFKDASLIPVIQSLPPRQPQGQPLHT